MSKNNLSSKYQKYTKHLFPSISFPGFGHKNKTKFILCSEITGLEKKEKKRKEKLPACPSGKQLSHFDCPGPLPAFLS